MTRTMTLFTHSVLPGARLKQGSLSEAATRADKSTWCGECRAGDHAACKGRRIRKYERGYGPCECAARGHGRAG